MALGSNKKAISGPTEKKIWRTDPTYKKSCKICNIFSVKYLFFFASLTETVEENHQNGLCEKQTVRREMKDVVTQYTSVTESVVFERN